ncbi:MAG: hypothetical protein IH621_02810 [Krumholzibacteria bacterium]|nr:hypothetical protein [Candidatus Krumholzibacteria bacterium]
MTIDDAFRRAAAHLDWTALAKSGDSTYFLDPALRLMGWNEAYLAFALANGADDLPERFPLGSDVAAAITGPLRRYYRRGFAGILAHGRPLHRQYECSSASELRLLHMSAYPIRGGAGLVVAHHVIHRAPHAGPSRSLRQHHADGHGFVVQCANCRKIRDHRSDNKWDRVPDVLAGPPRNVSHGLCPICLDHYYPDLEPES